MNFQTAWTKYLSQTAVDRGIIIAIYRARLDWMDYKLIVWIPAVYHKNSFHVNQLLLWYVEKYFRSLNFLLNFYRKHQFYSLVFDKKLLANRIFSQNKKHSNKLYLNVTFNNEIQNTMQVHKDHFFIRK